MKFNWILARYCPSTDFHGFRPTTAAPGPNKPPTQAKRMVPTPGQARSISKNSKIKIVPVVFLKPVSQKSVYEVSSQTIAAQGLIMILPTDNEMEIYKKLIEIVLTFPTRHTSRESRNSVYSISSQKIADQGLIMILPTDNDRADKEMRTLPILCTT